MKFIKKLTSYIIYNIIFNIRYYEIFKEIKICEYNNFVISYLILQY